MVLNDRGQSVRGVASQLGLAESSLRYRLQRARSGAPDRRRSRQVSSCQPHAAVIQRWLESQQFTHADGGREDVKGLWERLRIEEGYTGSYQSVLRYVAKRLPATACAVVRRVETLPGAQAQVDWVTRRLIVESLGGALLLHALVMTLSYSRMWAVVWSPTQDLLAWLEGHNGALSFLGGVPEVLRIDNLKTGVAQGAGPWAVIQGGYASYARQMGFLVNPCRARKASDKGKVERRGRDLDCLLLGGDERFADLASLQAVTDQRVLERAGRLCCPVTGQSILESWRAEQGRLRPLPPTLPQPFDLEVSRAVGRDCLVSFEGRRYSVPFLYAGRTVRLRGTAHEVQVFYEGKLLAGFPRRTACRLLVDQDHYEGPGDERVRAPTPLGQLGQRMVLRKSWEDPGTERPPARIGPEAALAVTPRRSIEHYEQLVRAQT